MPPNCSCGVPLSWVLDEDEEFRQPVVSVRADTLAELQLPRLSTGAHELDDLLGGGVARGSCVLVYGKRGAGKSRITYRFASTHRCLVVHPELAQEVARHILASTGAKLEHVHLLEQLDGWRAEATRLRARAVVLDSLAAAPDPVMALRAAQGWARKLRAVAYCIAHATKSGDHRGSTELSHWADYEWQIERAEGGALVRVLKTRLEPHGEVLVSLG